MPQFQLSNRFCEKASRASARWRRQPSAATLAGSRASRTAAAGDEPKLTDRYLLRLYVAGKNARAEQALANLRRICDEELDGRYELEVIDVLERPDLAEHEKVLATPTLIKRLPPPLRRVIGDLSDKEKVLLGLEVQPKAKAPRRGDAS